MATFIRLTDYKSSDAKEEGFFKLENRYKLDQNDFNKISGSPLAYKIVTNMNLFKKYSEYSLMNINSKIGSQPGSNLIIFIWEVSKKSLNQKWFIYNKGGTYRKWYGNQDWIVDYSNKGKRILLNGGQLSNQKYYGLKHISWTRVSSHMNLRFYPEGTLFDNTSPAIFENIYYFLAYLNSNVGEFNRLNKYSGGKIEAGHVNSISPFKADIKTEETIRNITQTNIDISKSEWDSRETSWDFTKNELLKHKQDGSLENALTVYSTHWTEQFNTLHSNEEELNRLFIDIYGLADELTPDVALEDITILKAEKKIVNGNLVFDKREIIKQFISYSVGCMLGRYSLDQDGLVVANLNQEIPTDTTYEIDDDNIIPIVDESDYFIDDMTDRFTEFVRTTFGSEKLQQNIAFIESSLGKKIRAYFQKDFYLDHTKRYKRRPIYWLFSSPKGTFQTLIYMHRYTPDTLNNILNDYLRPFRIRLDSMREESMRITESESSSSREKTDADKKIDKIDKTLDDINEYEKTLAHYAAMRIEIDLDDGVKVNYCKFKEVLFEFDKKLCK